MTLIQQARAILRKAFKRHDGKRPGMAAREKKALDALKQDDTTAPVHIIFPGVAAAREQSEKGGLPGIGGPNPGDGWCLKMVRMCYGIPAVALDAFGAWTAAQHKHHGIAPRGYPVFWSGGSHGHGHIAISAGDGMCWSTDIRRTGFFNKVPITDIHDRWGLTYLGWTSDLNGVAVPAEKETR